VTLADLETVTFSSPPPRVRTLATVEATHGMGPLEIDIRGVHFIGVEVLTAPPMPPSSELTTNACWALWQARVIPPNEGP
jgi:hypothetical protein